MPDTPAVVNVVNTPTKPVERKVAASSIGTYLGGAALTLLVQSLSDGSLIAALPPAVGVFLLPLAPALVAFVSGYLTTNRVTAESARELSGAALDEVHRRVDELVDAKLEQALGSRDSR